MRAARTWTDLLVFVKLKSGKKPKIDFKLQTKYLDHLPDHMNEVP